MNSSTSRRSLKIAAVKLGQKTIAFGKKKKQRKHRESKLKIRRTKLIKKSTLRTETS